ncbi:MAG: SPOR domain-containing protein [Chlorobiaceae bacterium]|nr:SPOR domain-containing protein [Chlorobiaceae bacterium]
MFRAYRNPIRKSAYLLLFLGLTVLYPAHSNLHAAVDVYNARLIRQYVDEDKVNLLENIRQKFTRPSEKLVVEALLCEDGPKAQAIYLKQLKEFPDPELDRISSSRIMAYNQVLNSTAPPPKLSQPSPATRPKFTGPNDMTVMQPPSGSPRDTGNRESPGMREYSGTQGTATSSSGQPQGTGGNPQGGTTAAGQSETVEPKENGGVKLDGFTLQFGSFGNIQNAEMLARKVSYYSPAETIGQNGIYRVRLKKSYPTREEAADAGRQLPFDAIVVPSRQ